jgi:predicted RNase H-like HicB family nuclease
MLPSQLYIDHSHGPVLAPATLAALPSTRAIETRSLPSSLAATHCGFAFYVTFPKSSIPSLATCSMPATT